MCSITKKIIFVCLGNICRSPLAEAIFNKKAKEKGLDKLWLADSCGTSDYNLGCAPDSRTLRNAEKNGVTIQHVARQLRATDLTEFDLLLVMDENNLKDILRLPGAEHHRHKIKLLRSFDDLNSIAIVPDPYFGTEKDFQNVFEILDGSIDCLIHYLQKRVSIPDQHLQR